MNHKKNLAIVCLFVFSLFFAQVSVVHAALDSDLQFGSKGQKVIELQNLLIVKGFLVGPATGNFYSLTKQAVIAFQKSVGVSPTGYVGPLTRSKLNAIATGTTSSSQKVATTSANANSLSISALVKQTPFFVTKNIWDFSSTSPFQSSTSQRPPERSFISTDQLTERPIDPKTVVMVRCKYVPTYKGGTKGGNISPVTVTGTGVVVSLEGHIITAAHILRSEEEMNYYDSERVWSRESCDVSPTESALTPIDPEPHLRGIAPDNFVTAQIIYEPTDSEYNSLIVPNPYNPARLEHLGGGADLDFAVLQVQGLGLPHVPLVKKLLLVKPGEKMIGLGYPGLAIPGPYSLERVDGQFNGFVWGESSSCVWKTEIEKCGISYQTKRYKNDYKSIYGKQTNLGKYTAYFRGGFSGGPLFYKGYVVGIMIYGKENEYSELYDLLTVGQWNWVEALSSHEILLTLEKKGITLSSAP